MKRQIIPFDDAPSISLSLRLMNRDADIIHTPYNEMQNISFNEGKTYIYRLLSTRIRSTYEVAQKLKEQEFLPHEVDLLMDYCTQNNLVNDHQFTQYFIQSYSESSRPIGNKALYQKLKEKGIATEIIEEYLNSYSQKNHDEIIEKTLELVENNLYRWDKYTDSYTKKQKIFEYLYRKGFEKQIIEIILNKITKV